jgi:hypothetical protein
MIMGIFDKLFGRSGDSDQPSDKKTFDFNKLVESNNINNSIIEFDNYIGDLCAYGEDMSKINYAQITFYLNQCCEREINNGGFNQFYYNSSGDFAHETVESLKKIGAVKTSEIVLKANNLFPNGEVPKNRNQRQRILEKIEDNVSDEWEKLNDKFMMYEEDLNHLNMTYIKKNKDKFDPNA